MLMAVVDCELRLAIWASLAVTSLYVPVDMGEALVRRARDRARTLDRTVVFILSFGRLKQLVCEIRSE